MITKAILRVGSALMSSCLLLLMAGGCDQGPQHVPVAGQVLIDGQPLTMGTIRFIPESGRPASAGITEDGSFRVITKTLAGSGTEVPGLVPGKYRMAVVASESLSDAEDAEVHWLAPAHYANFRTSGLEVDIQAPNEKMVVELTWEGAEEADESDEAASEKSKKEKSSDEEEVEKTPQKQKSDVK